MPHLHKTILNVMLLFFLIFSYSIAEEDIFSSYDEALSIYKIDPKKLESNSEKVKLYDFKRSQYPKIFRTFQKYADEGNYEAMSYMAQMHESGWGTKRDFGMALHYHRIAAKNGANDSKLYMSYYYLTGKGVMPNFFEARELLESLESDGDARAYINLGNIYEKGLGVPIDMDKAFAYYKKGADRNQPDCMYGLGIMYFKGISVEKNYKKAFELFKKATDLGYDYGYYYLGYAYTYGKGVSTDFVKAIDSYWRVPGYSSIGIFQRCYISQNIYGNGNYSKTFDLCRFSVREDGYCAENWMGTLYLDQGTYKGVEKNTDTGISYLKKSADKGCLDANINLYFYYRDGKHVTANKAKAMAYYQTINSLLYTDSFDKHTKRVYLTIEDYYGRPYIYNWLNQEAAKGHKKAQKILRLIKENEKYNQ